ncbi:DUF3558 family protein [Actinophytocola sp.]|uniref:DUF3558 family protein n=1 Tax=Actinophytocola sp. TaxID=1872138 RepID=UPI002ED93526
MAALAALVLLLAGCANEPAGDPAVTQPPSASGLPSGYQVPAIADPLDPGRFAADPCALLTPGQRTELGLPDTERNELAGTVECLLHPSGDKVTTVQLQLMTDRGLADLVAQCRGDSAPAACATWAPSTVERYPAVLDTGGQCRLMVGVAEQAVLLVNDEKEPECRRASEIATTALTTLREGS